MRCLYILQWCQSVSQDYKKSTQPLLRPVYALPSAFCCAAVICISKIKLFCLEMTLWTPETEQTVIFWVGLAAALIVLIINIPLLWIVTKTWNSSLINQLIGFDCLVALLHIPIILKAANILDQPCWFRKDAN